jgi:hypothetical protein
MKCLIDVYGIDGESYAPDDKFVELQLLNQKRMGDLMVNITISGNTYEIKAKDLFKAAEMLAKTD